MQKNSFAKMLVMAVIALSGSGAFAQSVPGLAAYEFLKNANDSTSVTGAILDGIRNSRATEFGAASAVIPKPLAVTDLQVVELQSESYPGRFGSDGKPVYMHDPYVRAQYMIVVTAVKRAYDGLLVNRQAIKFSCSVEIKPLEENGTKTVCQPRPLESVE
jgi:hypothetical protein